MKCRIMSFTFAAIALTVAHATAGEFTLDAFADGDSTYYEYISDGFVRMDLYSPLQPKNQSFHSITNPNTIYNQNFDGFPHDRIFHLGSVTYDESSLIEGTGSAPITALTLGIAKDPNNSGYINWNRFNTNTLVSSSTGNVNLAGGVPISMALTANLQLEVVTPFGSTENGYYPGTFTIDSASNRFSFEAEGHQIMDIIFGNDQDMHLRWDFAGVMLGFPPDDTSIADYDRNTVVDDIDQLLWQNTYGSTSHIAGDGNLDGAIDAADYVVWRKIASAAEAGQSSTSVPEPTAVALWMLAAAGLLMARRGHSA